MTYYRSLDHLIVAAIALNAGNVTRASKALADAVGSDDFDDMTNEVDNQQQTAKEDELQEQEDQAVVPGPQQRQQQARLRRALASRFTRADAEEDDLDEPLEADLDDDEQVLRPAQRQQQQTSARFIRNVRARFSN